MRIGKIDASGNYVSNNKTQVGSSSKSLNEPLLMFDNKKVGTPRNHEKMVKEDVSDSGKVYKEVEIYDSHNIIIARENRIYEKEATGKTVCSSKAVTTDLPDGSRKVEIHKSDLNDYDGLYLEQETISYPTGLQMIRIYKPCGGGKSELVEEKLVNIDVNKKNDNFEVIYRTDFIENKTYGNKPNKKQFKEMTGIY